VTCRHAAIVSSPKGLVSAKRVMRPAMRGMARSA
jgi:hypothetical protein